MDEFRSGAAGGGILGKLERNRVWTGAARADAKSSRASKNWFMSTTLQLAPSGLAGAEINETIDPRPRRGLSPGEIH